MGTGVCAASSVGEDRGRRTGRGIRGARPELGAPTGCRTCSVLEFYGRNARGHETSGTRPKSAASERRARGCERARLASVRESSVEPLLRGKQPRRCSRRLGVRRGGRQGVPRAPQTQCGADLSARRRNAQVRFARIFRERTIQISVRNHRFDRGFERVFIAPNADDRSRARTRFARVRARFQKRLNSTSSAPWV
jgi:hypothetical protein